MGYLLKEALKTLCGVNQWSYAVFWKMDCQNPRLLIWEECYCEAAASSVDLQGFSENGNLQIYLQDYNNSCATSESLNSWLTVPASDKVHLLVNNMMADGNVKVVGEGLIGRVAFTGNYQWILSENYCRESQSLEVLKDVLQLFSVGMQTVTVIPVLPHGVVQFASHVAVPEDIRFVKDVVSLILELGHILGVSQFENCESKQFMRGLFPLGSNRNSTYSAGTFKSPESSTQVTSFQASNSIDVEPYESKIAVPCLTSPNQIMNKVSENSSMGINLQSSPSMRASLPEKGLSPNGLKDPIFMEVSAFQDAVDLSRDDLLDVLAADFKKNMFNSCSNGRTRNEHRKIRPHAPRKLESGIFSFMGTNRPIDTTVPKGQPNMSLEESVSCLSTLTNIGGSSASKAFLTQGITETSNHIKGELFGISNNVAMGKVPSSTYSSGCCVYDPYAGKCFGLKQTESLASQYSAKLNVMRKPSRKRPKPGENPRRLRPRDHQMIQDRVKELREIVPDGAKCNIDCLLERTIKHMLFLQGVSKHADKLKQITESKSNGDLNLKDHGGGVTWAYEVGSQSTVCPIIVEDINQQPHQILVQRSFFGHSRCNEGIGVNLIEGAHGKSERQCVGLLHCGGNK